MDKLKPYKKEHDLSYTLGAFPTFELLKAQPQAVRAVYVHSAFEDKAGIRELCKQLGVAVVANDRSIERVSTKENVFVVGAFDKYTSTLANDRPHIVLDHTGDMGNLGTIVRTAVGFDYRDVAIVTPAADVWNPKTVRASMGAIFRLRHKLYDSFDAYRAEFSNHEVFCFMLDGAQPLTRETKPPSQPYTLVFGNEGSGLAPQYAAYGKTVFIPQSPDVDSLNLPVAAAIGMFMFRG